MRGLCVFVAVWVAAGSAACATPAEPPDPKSPVPIGTPSRKPLRVPASAQPEARPLTGEVPADVIAKLRADLSKQPGVDASSARVVSAQSIVWPSGALGCAQPGEMYTQATVPGYRVEFEAGGRTYAYHASEQGQFRLCPNSPRLPQ